jgi:hypothetical protein
MFTNFTMAITTVIFGIKWLAAGRIQNILMKLFIALSITIILIRIHSSTITDDNLMNRNLTGEESRFTNDACPTGLAINFPDITCSCITVSSTISVGTYLIEERAPGRTKGLSRRTPKNRMSLARAGECRGAATVIEQ